MCGFTLVFVALGMSATAVGVLIAGSLPALRTISGVFVLAMGIHLSGLIQVPFALRERRMSARAAGPLAPALLGATFGFAWTPCAGPILASILILASQQGTVIRGGMLLLAYSAGVALPFLLASLFLERAVRLVSRIRGGAPVIQKVAGVVMALLGISIIAGWF